jgi:hypothetical protein
LRASFNEDVDVTVWAGLTADDGPKQFQGSNAQLFQFGTMLAQAR